MPATPCDPGAANSRPAHGRRQGSERTAKRKAEGSEPGTDHIAAAGDPPPLHNPDSVEAGRRPPCRWPERMPRAATLTGSSRPADRASERIERDLAAGP